MKFNFMEPYSSTPIIDFNKYYYIIYVQYNHTNYFTFTNALVML